MKNTAKTQIDQALTTITRAGALKSEFKTKLEQRLQAAQAHAAEARQAYNAALANDDLAALKAAREMAEDAKAEIELTEAQINKDSNAAAFQAADYDEYYNLIKQALDESDKELAAAIEKAAAILAPAAKEHEHNLEAAQGAYDALVMYAPKEKERVTALFYPAQRQIYMFVKSILEKAKEYTR